MERRALDAEGNYVDHDVLSGPLPISDGSVDGVLASHFFEHFNAQDGLKIMKDCRRILKPGCHILVSVPDASYFRKVHADDRNCNWPELFGQTDPENPIPTFHEAALWFGEHFAILTEDAVWSYLTMAGFASVRRIDPFIYLESANDPAMEAMHKELNRKQFSLVMAGTKP
jgi:predicted SAM-dependent methyltransferase